MFSIQDITAQLTKGGRTFKLVINQPDLPVKQVAFIKNVPAESIAYCTDADISQFNLSNCTLICPESVDTSLNDSLNYILVDEPKIALYVAAQLFNEPKREGIHPSATVHPDAEIGEGTYIGPNVVIEHTVKIGKNCSIHANCMIYPHTTIEDNVLIEANCSIGPTAVYWTWDEKGQMWQLPQLGGVLIEEHCFLGTDVSIVRACFAGEVTKIGAYSKLAHGTKIGHDVQFGRSTHLANNVSIGGKVELKDRCFLGSGCTLKPGVHLQSDTIVGTGAVVTKSFEEERITLVGVPAKIMNTKGKTPSGMNAPLYQVKGK